MVCVRRGIAIVSSQKSDRWTKAAVLKADRGRELVDGCIAIFFTNAEQHVSRLRYFAADYGYGGMGNTVALLAGFRDPVRLCFVIDIFTLLGYLLFFSIHQSILE